MPPDSTATPALALCPTPGPQPLSFSLREPWTPLSMSWAAPSLTQPLRWMTGGFGPLPGFSPLSTLLASNRAPQHCLLSWARKPSAVKERYDPFRVAPTQTGTDEVPPSDLGT
jgi:hypothetical protein